jgi:hypothetical protein
MIDLVCNVSSIFHIDPRSYVSGVALQSCCDRSLH